MSEKPVYALPTEIKKQVNVLNLTVSDEFVQHIWKIAAEIKKDNPDTIIATGAGDSLFAGMAAQEYFARFAHRFIFPVDVLEYSRHLYRALTPHSVTFAISYSGETVRSLEACYAARAAGSRLIVMTRDPQSSMARMADYVILNQAGFEDSNCRTGSFQSMQLTFLLFALAMGEESPTTPTSQKVLNSLRGLVQPLTRFVDEMDPAMEKLAAQLLNTRRYYFLGAGVGLAAAHFAAAKFYETFSTPALVAELEQFCHCEIFSADPGDSVVIIAQKGSSYSRAIEVADGVRKIGATVWGVSDVPEFAAHCDHFTLFPGTPMEELSLIPAVIPFPWFGYYQALATGENPDRVNHKDVNSPLIRQCAYWNETDYASQTQ
jgi:glutamine---fructose-6-phosphate transaminase (isomerizing)